MTAPAPSPRELVLTRVLDAPRALVFEAWTDPQHLAHWWGPDGFTSPECEVDLRPGGALFIRMVGHGFDEKMYGTFVEISAPERLVYKSFLRDGTGATYLETLNTVTFAERDGKTTMTVNVRVTFAGPAAAGPLEGMDEGWRQMLARLAGYVAGMAKGQSSQA
jgi:uncharacterized protein YndB with AHSA1/START domain